MSFVTIRAVLVASTLPWGSGCASWGDSSTFESGDAAADGEDLYDPPPLWSGGAPVLIGKGQEAVSLALDSSNAYWQNPGGSVFGCPLDGCPMSKPTLLSSLTGPGGGALETLAAGNGIALFLSSGGTAISAFDGVNPDHSPTTYWTTAGAGLSSLATDATDAYFIDTSTGDAGYQATLYSCRIGAACSSPTRLHDGATGPLFVANSEVYFLDFVNTTGIAIRAVPIHGGASRKVCDAENLYQVRSLAVAGGYAYFTTTGEPASVYQCAASGGSAPAVYIQDLQPYALASDGANLYWTNYVAGPGSVVTCALGATCNSPFTVASTQEDPFAIAANAKSVYWTTPSSVYRADR
jgi:hypothetical protein